MIVLTSNQAAPIKRLERREHISEFKQRIIDYIRQSEEIVLRLDRRNLWDYLYKQFEDIIRSDIRPRQLTQIITDTVLELMPERPKRYISSDCKPFPSFTETDGSSDEENDPFNKALRDDDQRYSLHPLQSSRSSQQPQSRNKNRPNSLTPEARRKGLQIIEEFNRRPRPEDFPLPLSPNKRSTTPIDPLDQAFMY